MRVQSYSKYVRVSPKKLRFIADAVKKMPPVRALDALAAAPGRSTKILYKTLKSAVDNAINILKLKADMLEFKALLIEEGVRLKRYRRGGRGTAKPYIRPTAHIKVVLTDKS